MTEQIVDTTADATLDADGIAKAVPEADGSQDALAQRDDARRRQAGADAARAVAEQKAAALEAENAKFRAAELERQQAGMSETAKLQAERDAAIRRADEAEARADAKLLDKLYPKARAEYPEVRDEAKLARLETLLAEPSGDTPAPNGIDASRSMRAPKDASASTPKAATSAEIFAGLPKEWPKS